MWVHGYVAKMLYQLKQLVHMYLHWSSYLRQWLRETPSSIDTRPQPKLIFSLHEYELDTFSVEFGLGSNGLV